MTDIERCKETVREGTTPLGLDYIPLFPDFYNRYSELSYEERGRLVWAMLAYARGMDPSAHLTEELRRFCFPNERDVIARTAKVHQERKERLRAASQIANAVKYSRSESEPIGANRSESVRIGPNRSHNNNNNNNNNYNNNNNDNGRGCTTTVHRENQRGQAGRPDPVGREIIL